MDLGPNHNDQMQLTKVERDLNVSEKELFSRDAVYPMKENFKC